MLLLIIVFTFIIVLTILTTIYLYFTAEKQVVHERIGRYVANNQADDSQATAATMIAGHELTGWRAMVRWLSKYLESPHWSSNMEHKLVQAGLPLRGSEFLVICLAVMFVCSVVVFIASGGKVIMGVIGGLCGYLIPLLVLRIKIERRSKAFNDQLGDCLVLIANSLRTGYSFMQAIEMVAKEMLPPISLEFARVLKEMNLGVTTEAAMNNLAKRVNSDNLELVITAVLIQRQVGGNLAEVLDNISHTIRERVKIKGHIKTLTAQGRISGIIIGALPICIGGLLYIINPEYIKILFIHPMGQAMLVGGIISQVIGVIFIRKIIAIEV